MPSFIVAILNNLPYEKDKSSEAPSFSEALLFLTTEIDKTYRKIRNQYADTPVVIACQEYCLFGNVERSGTKLFLNNRQREEFEEQMRKVCVGKRNVTLVCGTIAYYTDMLYKPSFSISKVKNTFAKVKELYPDSPFLLASIGSAEARAIKAFELYSQYDESLFRIKNVCYIFQTPIVQAQTEEEVVVYKHKKISPSFEEDACDCAAPSKNRFFQPGLDTNIINFGGEFKLSIEICVEYMDGVWNRKIREERPDLELVVSDYINLRAFQPSAVGAVKVFADSRNFCSFIPPHSDVILYAYPNRVGIGKIMQSYPEPKKSPCILM